MLGELADQLGDGQLVGLADVVEHAEGVVLNHDVVGADGLLRLVHPPLHNVKARLGQVLKQEPSY